MTIDNQIDYLKNKLEKYTKDKDLIDELVQLVIIKINEKSYKNYSEYQYKRLLSLIARSAYIDYYRANKNNLLTSIDTINDLVENESIHINKDILFKSIDKLPERQRETIILRYYFGLKYDKISKLFNVSKNTALGYFHKAKINLSKFLTKNQVYEH